MADTTQVVHSERARNAQEALDRARHVHMLAIQEAFAAGVPAADIDHGTKNFLQGVGVLATKLTLPGGDAPMFLGRRL